MGEWYFKFWYVSKFFIFSGIGLMMFEQGCSNLTEINRVDDWEKASGVITERSVLTSMTKKGIKLYEPHVTYTYKVNGKDYEKTVIQVGKKERVSSKWDAKMRTKSYPVNKEVLVLSDQVNPQNSTLKNGDKSSERFLMYLGSFFFLLAYLINRKSIHHAFKKLFFKNYKRKNEGWLVAQ